MAREPLTLEIEAAALRHARTARVLRWVAMVWLLPTVVFPFAWALATWTVLRLERWYLDARGALRRSGRSKGALSIDEAGLCLEIASERLALPRAEVEEGWLEPGRTPVRGLEGVLGPVGASDQVAAGGDTSVVALRSSRGSLLYLEVEDDAQARRVLEAMGVGPLQQLLRVPLGSHASQAGEGAVFHLLGPLLLVFVSFTPIVLALAALADGSVLGVLVGLAVLALTAGAWAGLYRYSASGTAVVGADGLSIEYPLRRSRFIEHARITDIRAHAQGVTLSSGGHLIRLPTASYVSDAPGYTRALAARIRQARDEAVGRGAQGAAQAKLQSLERGGKTLGAWREELARLAADAGDYRRVGFAPEELADVVGDPTAPPDRRLGAALALRGRAGESERTRARIAAAACAHAPLRIAIESALEGELEDDVIERAVAARPAPRTVG